LLTGVAVGTADAEGKLPEGSLNRRVAQRLEHLAELRRKYARKAESGRGGSHEKNDD